MENSSMASKINISMWLRKKKEKKELMFKLHLFPILYEWDSEHLIGSLGMGCTVSSESLPRSLERLRREHIVQGLNSRYGEALEHHWSPISA